jgi:hypothetical protein
MHVDATRQRKIRGMRTQAPLALLLVMAPAMVLATDPAPPLLRLPGAADRPIEPGSLLGRDRSDVRVEDSRGDVTIFHGMPLLDVLERGGLETKTMQAQRKVATAVVLVTARDGYTVVFSVGELLMHRADPRVFLVAETSQGPLPENEGPVRLAVLGDRTRSPYALAKIEVRYLADNAAERKK